MCAQSHENFFYRFLAKIRFFLSVFVFTCEVYYTWMESIVQETNIAAAAYVINDRRLWKISRSVFALGKRSEAIFHYHNIAGKIVRCLWRCDVWLSNIVQNHLNTAKYMQRHRDRERAKASSSYETRSLHESYNMCVLMLKRRLTKIHSAVLYISILLGKRSANS